MEKIIVPLDFSEHSEYALQVAASLAKKHNAELLALHMLELNHAMISSAEGMHPEQTVFWIKLAEKRFGEFLDKPYLKGIKITPIVKHYKVFSEVDEVGKEHGADLVVMGSHGVDGLKELFVGSNAEKVVRNSEIPVLVVKEEMKGFSIDQFVFACDFTEENIPALEKARTFADKMGANLQLVYINTPGDKFLSTKDAYERITAFLAKVNMGVEVDIHNGYSVEQGILEYSDNVGADIIGIPTHGRKGLAHFFMGSIGEDIANHSTVPVVTFKI
ncbi:MAG: universal stress protein [Flavobacteriaceae bacterium]